MWLSCASGGGALVVLSRGCTLSVGESAPAGGASKLQPQPRPGAGSEPAWPTQVGGRGEGISGSGASLLLPELGD